MDRVMCSPTTAGVHPLIIKANVVFMQNIRRRKSQIGCVIRKRSHIRDSDGIDVCGLNPGTGMGLHQAEGWRSYNVYCEATIRPNKKNF